MHEPIQVRRLNVAIAKRGDGIEPLIVAEKDEDVRFLLRVGGAGGCGRKGERG
jgi:hypothetical protein